MSGLKVVLASRSPARLATLRSAGVDPEVVVSGFDEDSITEADPSRLVAALARAKVGVIADRLPAGDLVVIGCDSVLDFEGEIHGKPADAGQATRRWQRLRGRTGVLRTGHHVLLRRDGAEADLTRVASTTVHFADLADAEIAAYVATGEPVEVAGAFTLDGLGGAYVTGIEGDPHNVVGISLPLLRTMLAELGVAWHTLWRPTP
ncbi:MAG: Maf family protein [Propionicimonas sp.]|nr:Maf family protein [Propionicimonas sp.]